MNCSNILPLQLIQHIILNLKLMFSFARSLVMTYFLVRLFSLMNMRPIFYSKTALTRNIFCNIYL